MVWICRHAWKLPRGESNCADPRSKAFKDIPGMSSGITRDAKNSAFPLFLRTAMVSELGLLPDSVTCSSAVLTRLRDVVHQTLLKLAALVLGLAGVNRGQGAV